MKNVPRADAGKIRAVAVVAGVLVTGLLTAAPAWGCFGVRLRVGVVSEPGPALASFAAGYFVEEKTGIEPEFVSVTDPAGALASGAIDLCLTDSRGAPPGNATSRSLGPVPGVGPARMWLRTEILDDLRFFTVDRALSSLPSLFGSEAYRNALGTDSPRRAARRAVLRAD